MASAASAPSPPGARANAAASRANAASTVAHAAVRVWNVTANATTPYSSGYAGESAPPDTASTAYTPAISASPSWISIRAGAARKSADTRCARADGSSNRSRALIDAITSTITAATSITGTAGGSA